MAVHNSNFATYVRFSFSSIVMGTSVRFVVLASVTFLNSISVSSVDSWPLGYPVIPAVL